MPWPTPQYSRSEVNRAGDVLRQQDYDSDNWLDAMDVMSNWRSCHGYPINTFQATLREKLTMIEQDAIVAQRLKRTPSIISKLKRFPKMDLARMQDMGGVRAVVSSLDKARELRLSYQNSRFEHELVDKKDYIAQPKTSGYRSIHLVYRYKNRRAPEYDGLFLELQIRTRLQHAWAVAVETMGIFLNQSLKSSEGSDRWLNFFALTGAAFAHIENSPPVPGYESISQSDLYKSVTEDARGLNVYHQLEGLTVAAHFISSEQRRAAYHLIVLDPVGRSVMIQSFGRKHLDEANRVYIAEEEKIAGGAPHQAVLVSTGSIDSLRRAYPSYFLDSQQFLTELGRIEQTAYRPVNKKGRRGPKSGR